MAKVVEENEELYAALADDGDDESSAVDFWKDFAEEPKPDAIQFVFLVQLVEMNWRNLPLNVV